MSDKFNLHDVEKFKNALSVLECFIVASLTFRFDMTKPQNYYCGDHVLRKVCDIREDVKHNISIHVNISLS